MLTASPRLLLFELGWILGSIEGPASDAGSPAAAALSDVPTPMDNGILVKLLPGPKDRASNRSTGQLPSLAWQQAKLHPKALLRANFFLQN